MSSLPNRSQRKARNRKMAILLLLSSHSDRYLYFKMSTNETFTSYDHDAAGDIIPEVTITRLDGGDSPAVCTMDNPPYQNPQVKTVL